MDLDAHLGRARGRILPTMSADEYLTKSYRGLESIPLNFLIFQIVQNSLIHLQRLPIGHKLMRIAKTQLIFGLFIIHYASGNLITADFSQGTDGWNHDKDYGHPN